MSRNSGCTYKPLEVVLKTIIAHPAVAYQVFVVNDESCASIGPKLMMLIPEHLQAWLTMQRHRQLIIVLCFPLISIVGT